jgi:uncharacterized protein YecE (DUF72 family)
MSGKKKSLPTCHIGTSGWSYEHWKETFYPEGLKAVEWLNYYAKIFSTVEINTTFYHTPRHKTVQHWHDQVSKDFIFSMKMNRYITHRKKLNDSQESLEIFYKSIQHLKAKVGPILVQLPPSFKINEERLITFINLLDHQYRYTFEFRHESWFVDRVYEILKEHQMALCITDLNGKQSPEEITADYTYIRLHGPHHAYQGSYGPKRLKVWKEKIEKWLTDCSVYCYFDNDEKSYATKDAQFLQDLFRP